LPQSYTAVIHGFLQEGDLETAEAVYASNRRAGVSSAKSWAAICTALLNAGEHDRALKLLNQASWENLHAKMTWMPMSKTIHSIHSLCSADVLLCMYLYINIYKYMLYSSIMQGEEEGMIPDDRLYEAVIKSFCRQGDLSSGLHRLQEMQSQGLQPKKDHISALVTAHALAGKTYGGSDLLSTLRIRF